MTVTLECGLYILQVMAFRVLGLPLPALLLSLMYKAKVCQEGTAQNLSIYIPVVPSQSSSHALFFHYHSEANSLFQELVLGTGEMD